MEMMIQAIRQLIQLSEAEAERFVRDCRAVSFSRNEELLAAGPVPQKILFVLEGVVRVTIDDLAGKEHTVHFARPMEFITDYSAFLEGIGAAFAVRAVSAGRAVVLPRSTIEWGYAHLQDGEKLGRTVAEYYFTYLDNRIKRLFTLSPMERYTNIGKVFPGIHDQVPQHMIASYLGSTPVHLSRLKRELRSKV